MTVALIADTHMPDREQEIPEEFRERIRAADHVVHAGDFTGADTLAEVRELAGDLTAVHGNMDPDDIGLPTVATLEVEDVTVVVTHGTVGSLDEWYDAVADATREHAEEPRVGVGAHTHQVEDTVHDGIRLVNPGSVTGAAPAERATMMTLDVDGGDVDVIVHEL